MEHSGATDREKQINKPPLVKNNIYKVIKLQQITAKPEVLVARRPINVFHWPHPVRTHTHTYKTPYNFNKHQNVKLMNTQFSLQQEKYFFCVFLFYSMIIYTKERDFGG